MALLLFIVSLYALLSWSAFGEYQVVETNIRSDGLTLNLQLTTAPPQPYGHDIQHLRVDVTFQTQERIRIKISDPAKKRWEIPTRILPDGETSKNVHDSKLKYAFSYTSNPFGFAVKRIDDGEIMFNASALVFEDQYLEMSTSLPYDANIYGFGERVDSLRLNNSGKVYTMWSSDAGTPPDQNLYGVHPFYLELRKGRSHGVWLRNSNAMEVLLNKDKLTYFITGGILDFYVFIGGEKPETVVQQYQRLIGKPYMPNFWTLGWHQCRWGTSNLSVLENVVEKYAENNIPLETIWSDIDYMDQHRDYSWDPVNFNQAEIQKFVKKIHKNGQHYVVIVDPGIPYLPGYAPYDSGVQQDIFIKNSSGEIFVGKVWPGLTAFPDFLNPKTKDYWNDLISEFLDKVPIDGLWIDMNECSNFCNGQCNLTTGEDLHPAKYFEKLPLGPNNPPYKINHLNQHAPLNTKTMDMDAIHYGDVIEYDVHSMYGFLESIATKLALEGYYGKRAFVLSRSTFSGSGKHTAHWLGDNYSTYQSMKGSIPGAMLMNMFGIPMVGADICGFVFSTTEELCAKWHAFGAYYTFARNHNELNAIDQYPYLWESVKKAAIKNLNNRYSILSYYYTLFFKAHSNGGTVFRPLFFEFPKDEETYAIDEQFMIGEAFLFAPNLEPNSTQVQVYLPASIWYDWWTGAVVTKNSKPHRITVDTPWDHVPIYLKGGSIIFKRKPELTLKKTLKNSFHVVVALDCYKNAQGDVFIDDGSELNVGKSASLIGLKVHQESIQPEVYFDLYNGHQVSKAISEISIWGVSERPKVVFVGQDSIAFRYNPDLEVLHVLLPKGIPLTQFTMFWE